LRARLDRDDVETGEAFTPQTSHGTGLVALVSDGEAVRLDVGPAPTFADPQAAIAWSGGVTTSLKSDVQAKSLIGLGSARASRSASSARAGCSSSPQRAGSSRSAEA
jgi:uncharacterized protein (AIM24 family)